MIFGQGGLAVGQFDRSDTQTPHISLGVVARLSNDLGCHPEGCSDESMAEGVGELRGDAEIGELDFARGGEEDIGSLDIAVNGTLRVKIVQAEEEFATHDRDVIFGEDASLEQVETRATSQVLHDDPELVGNNEGSIVLGHVFRVALCETCDLLLNL